MYNNKSVFHFTLFIDHDVTLLVNENRGLGSRNADCKISVKFCVLFDDDTRVNLFETLVGTLKAAKLKIMMTSLHFSSYCKESVIMSMLYY
ncbi:hypothetical protein Q7C36_019532 [Tachysurus vachellii]|uniref:Costars family protein ABRACL n=1 Tax=Tachysurus vachellii TaxID=175792 RepID=A0AA88LWN8_TACVA|nr:hypothetical protein Q7C36_019532 [Tachysurus vachellii]